MAKHRIAVEHMNTYSTERQWSTMQLFFFNEEELYELTWGDFPDIL